MATGELNGVIHHLRAAMLSRDVAGLTDGQLLDAFVIHSDDAALGTIVQRHGPMVWRIF